MKPGDLVEPRKPRPIEIHEEYYPGLITQVFHDENPHNNSIEVLWRNGEVNTWNLSYFRSTFKVIR